MNAEDLARFDAEIKAYAAASRPLLQSVLILHHGKLTSEHYWRGFAATSYQPVFSITKTVVSALIGMALADGRLTLTDTMAEWFPEMGFAPGAHAASVTIRHLLTMTAGFHDVGGGGFPIFPSRRCSDAHPLLLLVKSSVMPAKMSIFSSPSWSVLLANQ